MYCVTRACIVIQKKKITHKLFFCVTYKLAIYIIYYSWQGIFHFGAIAPIEYLRWSTDARLQKLKLYLLIDLKHHIYSSNKSVLQFFKSNKSNWNKKEFKVYRYPQVKKSNIKILKNLFTLKHDEEFRLDKL